jgi:hypothetical protein
VEPNGPGSIPGGSGFCFQPIRVFPTTPKSGGFNNPFRGREYGGPALSYLRCFGKILFCCLFKIPKTP